MVCNGMRNHTHTHTHTHTYETPKLKAIVDKDAYNVPSLSPLLTCIHLPSPVFQRIVSLRKYIFRLPSTYPVDSARQSLGIAVDVTSSYPSSGLMRWLAPYRNNILFAWRSFFTFSNAKTKTKSRSSCRIVCCDWARIIQQVVQTPIGQLSARKAVEAVTLLQLPQNFSNKETNYYRYF